MKVAVTVPRIGPYHAARFYAASRGGEVTVLETQQRDSEYAWDVVDDVSGFARVTLLDMARYGGAVRRRRALLKARIHAALDGLRPDVVAVTGWSQFESYIAARWSARSGVPVVVMSESQLSDAPRYLVREWMKRLFLSGCAAALVGGVRHAEYARALGMPSESIFTGYDVVDTYHFSRGAEAVRQTSAFAIPREGSSDRYFLASCRFVEKKNLPRLLQAYALYKERHKSAYWKLVILGDGPQRALLVRQRDELGLTADVHFPGFIQYPELPSYYGGASAFVHVSTVEQWGLVVNEAIASRLPVIVSRQCGCAPDLVEEGGNGWIVDAWSEQSIAKALIDCHQQSTRLDSMGGKSAAISENFNAERFAEGFWKAASHAASGIARRRPSALLNTLLNTRAAFSV